MGTCFEKIDKKNEAVKCFEKAESCKDKECIFYFYKVLLYFSWLNSMIF